MKQLFLFEKEERKLVCHVYFDGTGIVSGKGPLIAIFDDQNSAESLLSNDVGFHYKWGSHPSDNAAPTYSQSRPFSCCNDDHRVTRSRLAPEGLHNA